MFKFKKKSESGRSMVEMLGVLAIIGVLSIGGIAGYTLSMRRYRANQVLDAVSKYSLIVYSACQKAIINGDITSYNSCYELSPWPTFQEAGLGTVADISTIGIASMGTGFGAMCNLEGVNTTDGDLMKIGVTFNDAALCKSAKSITGSKDTISCTGRNLKFLCYEVLYK